MGELSRPVAQALDLLVTADPPRLTVSNVTDPEAGTIAHKTARRLAEHGYAHLLESGVVATDAGRARAAAGFEFPDRRYPHGTHACYVLDGCRCDRCREACRTYERHRGRAQRSGQPVTVDAGPVRAHVRSLMADGRGDNLGAVGLKQIAKVSGVAHGALWKLIYGAPDRAGPSKRVRRDTAERVLAVTRADMADGATVPAEGTWRRVDQMVAAGWAKAAIARHVHGPQAVALQLSRRTVTAGNARKVAALHAAWTAGEVEVEGRRGRRRGVMADA